MRAQNLFFLTSGLTQEPGVCRHLPEKITLRLKGLQNHRESAGARQ